MSKHPYELNCSRELGHKTKTYPFEPSFLLYFSDSNLLSFQSLSSYLLKYLNNSNSPNFYLFLPFELLGNHRFFTGRLVIMGGLGFSLAYFEDMALLGSNSGTKVYALAYE